MHLQSLKCICYRLMHLYLFHTSTTPRILRATVALYNIATLVLLNRTIRPQLPSRFSWMGATRAEWGIQISHRNIPISGTAMTSLRDGRHRPAKPLSIKSLLAVGIPIITGVASRELNSCFWTRCSVLTSPLCLQSCAPTNGVEVGRSCFRCNLL